MAKTKRIRWADVYQCEIPAHARLIASVLAANGLEAKVERKKPKQAQTAVPFVRVKKTQQQLALTLMSSYKLVN